jgi:DNA-binding transcriptional LysR family regulator
MNIRHLRYFVALAREQHYARAASSCHVTQPTLSEAVRQLEAELGVPLVERSRQRFRGLTPEGMRALGWAQRIIADNDALAQDLTELKRGFSGTLRLAAIPAAMAVTPLIVTPFSRRHPLVTIKVVSRSSIEIQRGLDEFDLEVALTYLENEPLRNVRTLPLYREHYMLLTPAQGGPFDRRESVTWCEAATLPLCLFTTEMQNRRIVDRLFREAGAAPRATVETNSVVALCAHVRIGGWSSVVPHTFLAFLGSLDGLRAIPLVEPTASQCVGLVASDREPLAPLARAVLACARQIDISAQLDLMLRAMPPGSSAVPMSRTLIPI